MTKPQALEEMKKPNIDPKILQEDYQYVLKKLQLSEEEFEAIMKLPIKNHVDFDSYIKKHYSYNARFFKFISPLTSISKTILKRK